MRCPSCQQTLSFFLVRERFHCPKCGAALKGKNYGSVVWIWLTVWLFFISPWILAKYDFALGAIGAVLLIGVVLFLPLKRYIIVLPDSEPKNAGTSINP